MTGKKIGVLASAAALAIGALIASDCGLRAQSGWIGQERKKSETTQPFLANWVFPTKFQVRLQAQRIVDRAEEVDSQDSRASLFFQAVELLKDKDDAEQRAYLLRRVCDECPDSLRSAEAWSLRLRAKLGDKPPSDPAGEVTQLIACIQRFGVGDGKVSPASIQECVKAMEGPFPDRAKSLQSALDAATPKQEEPPK